MDHIKKYLKWYFKCLFYPFKLPFKANWKIRFSLIPILLLFLLLLLAVFKNGNFKLSAFQFTKPKPITSSNQKLPQNIQQAIANLAKEEIKQQQANVNLAINNSTQNNPTAVLQPLVDSVQELIDTNPSDKAKIKMRRIDRLIVSLENLLTNDQSDQAVDQAVKLVQEIGKQTDEIVKDPKIQTDREILKSQIEQYNRLQLTLQKLEDKLPIKAYLKIEDARQKYLVVTATASINNAPNLDAVHNIAVKEVEKVVGSDFADLKAIEIIADFEAGVKPEAKQKLTGLEKELAQSFEKKMLKLPQDVRARKLQDFIKYSFGNPLKQAESFERMKNFLNDREMILGVDSLKELALHKLEDRVFEIKDQDSLNQFLDLSFKSPDDLKILVQLKLDVLAGKDSNRKAQITTLEQNSLGKVVQAFGKAENLASFFSPEASGSGDILDVSLIAQLSDTLNKSTQVPVDTKTTIKGIKEKTLQNFAQKLGQSNFTTQAKLSYNPVSQNSDVRILLVDPQVIPLLEEIKKQLPDKDKGKINIAEKSATLLLADHLLSHVSDPEIFEDHQAFITDNPQVKQLIQSYLGQSFFTSLTKKKQILDKKVKQDEQALYEKMQQITQAIFITTIGQKSNEERSLPADIQTAIDDLKNKLSVKAVPKLDTPEGVSLPEVAKLPSEVEQAIVEVAKDKIANGKKTAEAKLDLAVQAKDLGVSDPTILPDNPLYLIKQLARNINLLITLDPIQRAAELIKQDNEKTLEAAKLVEESGSQKVIDTALNTLSSVQADFDKLKEHADDLKKLEQTQSVKVDQLVDQLIENGVARQTVFSAIEDKVHGDDFVNTEKIRSDILKDGIDTLLQLTDNNVAKLTEKLETAVQKESGSELKDIKAVELLVEIARTQPQSSQPILKKSEANLAQNLENKLLEMPKEEMIQKVLDYVEAEPGNPVRQFEAADVLKDNFKNPETILLTEGIKDKAVKHLEERVSEITDDTARQEFVSEVVGDKPQDLKIAVEIESRVEVPVSTGVEPTPIVEKIEEIKADVEQNIIDTYKDKPQELAKTDLLTQQSPDVSDIKTTQELTEALARSPEVSKEVIAVAQKGEETILDKFVETISSSQFSPTTQTAVSTLAEETLSSVPETVAELVDLKNQTPPEIDAKIDVAIKAEVNLIEQHITTEVNDQVTLQTYQAQITQNPIVAQVVVQVGGTQFTQAVEEKAQIVEQTAAKEQTQLNQTVEQVTQEVFSTPAGGTSSAESSLPASVQQQVEEIKQQVPVEQISVSVQAPAPAAPQPAAPTVESKPAEQPAAPAAPEAPAPAAVPAL